ncbi:TPA: Tfp pilus assembly protein FimT/FimU [Vibrio parahaemolyticus]
MKRTNGFALIEMLISVTIIVILTNVSIPYFTNAYHSFKADRAFSEFSSSLRNARVASITSNEAVEINFYSSGDNHIVDIVQSNKSIKQLKLNKSDFDLEGQKFVYTQEGYAMPSSGNGSVIKLCHKHLNEQHAYSINPIGKMNVEVSDC